MNESICAISFPCINVHVWPQLEQKIILGRFSQYAGQGTNVIHKDQQKLSATFNDNKVDTYHLQFL